MSHPGNDPLTDEELAMLSDGARTVIAVRKLEALAIRATEEIRLLRAASRMDAAERRAFMAWMMARKIDGWSSALAGVGGLVDQMCDTCGEPLRAGVDWTKGVGGRMIPPHACNPATSTCDLCGLRFDRSGKTRHIPAELLAELAKQGDFRVNTRCPRFVGADELWNCRGESLAAVADVQRAKGDAAT